MLRWSYISIAGEVVASWAPKGAKTARPFTKQSADSLLRDCRTPFAHHHLPFREVTYQLEHSQRRRITGFLELEAGKANPMITIHTSSTGKTGKVRVTFEMPATDPYDSLYLVGWFNESDETVYRMERIPEGKWSLTLELEPGCEYQYRYRTPDGEWLQDPAPASAQFGFNNSFLISSDRTG